MENNNNPYSKYSAEEILNGNLILEMLDLPIADLREKMLLNLEERAKQLKIATNFRRLVKTLQAEMIQEKKQENSTEIQFLNVPGGLKLKCKNYICNDLGVTKPDFDAILMKPRNIIVCTHPILPIERLINIDTNVEKIKLTFYKDKKWKHVIAERNTLASKNKILQLANTGIEVNENNAKELISYISELISINSEDIPCYRAITHLGWINDESEPEILSVNKFIPYIDNYKFDGDRSFESIFKDIKERGNYEKWKLTIQELRKSSETLHFMIAASFASVLIEKVHINPFIVHLWGKSGTGKTIALMIAMSIWGNPKIGHLVKNLNSTNVGLERLSSFLNNIPFAGDELQSIKNKYTDFNELIYSLTQGEGKSRGTVDGGIAEQLKWNCLFLTTGEEPITSEYSKEGVKNRVIEIEENEAIVENGKDIVNILVENYGFAGREFVENLPESEELIKRHTEIFNKLNELVGSTGKQTNAIALVLLADEIISKNIFYDDSLTIKDCRKYFTKDIDEAERIYNLIINWFNENLNRFNGNEKVEQWGKYKSIDGEVTAIFVNPKILKDFLNSNNINFNGIKNKLFEKGYLEKNVQNEFTQSQRINGIVQRVIKINVNSCIEQPDLEELPF